MVKKPIVTQKTIHELLEKVDPLQATVMVLGGTAAACGIVPPLTRLLMTFGGSMADISNALMQPGYKTLATLDWFTPGWVLISQAGQPVDQTTKDAAQAKLGLFCSGAVEACLMYALVSNPETLKTVLALPGQILQGVGKIV